MRDTIQDIRAFEEKLFDLVQQFIDNSDEYPSDAVLTINNNNKEINIDIDNDSINTDTYNMSVLIRDDEDGNPEPDIDFLNEIASKYYFVR